VVIYDVDESNNNKTSTANIIINSVESNLQTFSTDRALFMYSKNQIKLRLRISIACVATFLSKSAYT
jgi:hypothetical protein